MTRLFVIPMTLLLLLAAGCGADRQPLVVGSKSSPENQLVAEAVAQLAEASDIPVVRRIGLDSTRQALEALKRGDIDVYPEYSGTGLAMLGVASIRDPDRAMALVRERFAPLSLGWSDPLGFEGHYALAMLSDRARALGIKTLSQLAARSDKLVLGVEDEFAARPVDGLQPLLRRYGMRFKDVIESPLDARMQLYEALLERRIDVALVQYSDAQIEHFDLRLLADDLHFFSVYQASLLYREQTMERFPPLAKVFEKLEGRLSGETIRRLGGRVTLRGESPAEVVRTELVRLGLVTGSTTTTPRQGLDIAVSPSANADGEAAMVLRALRRAYPSRNVQLMPAPDPLEEVIAGRARVALVAAPAFFSPGSPDPATGQPRLRPGVEAVALVGTSYAQAFALKPHVRSLHDAERIAVSAEGSSGHRGAQSLVDALALDAELVPVEADTAEALADALVATDADAALLIQAIGNWTALDLLGRGLRLLPITGWSTGNNRLVFPYFQPATLTAADFAPFLQSGTSVSSAPHPFARPLETLMTQLVLAGPAPPPDSAIGNQGPVAGLIGQTMPLRDQSVGRINAALDTKGQINPILPQAAALAPKLPDPPAPVNPSPAVSTLNVLVIAMLVWMLWLLLRGSGARHP